MVPHVHKRPRVAEYGHHFRLHASVASAASVAVNANVLEDITVIGLLNGVDEFLLGNSRVSILVERTEDL